MRLFVNFLVIVLWSVFVEIIVFILQILRSYQPQLQTRDTFQERQRFLKLCSQANKQIIFFHCSSAGEYEQIAPVIDLLKTRYSNFEPLIFFQSISGKNFLEAKKERVANIFLSPIDSLFRWKWYFEVAKPNALIFVRHELWPSLIFAAKAKNCLTLAFCVQNTQKKSLLKELLKNYLLGSLDFVGVVSSQDALALKKLNLGRKLEALGDPKYERALQHASSSSSTSTDVKETVNSFSVGRKIILIGSAWPEDLQFVLEAISEHPQLNQRTDFCLLVIPHDISDGNLMKMQHILNHYDLKKRSLVLPIVGVLSKLYGMANCCFIGGSVARKIHNVVEPLAHRIPIFFGNYFGNSIEAIQLKNQHLAFETESPQALAHKLFEVLEGNYEDLSKQQAHFIELQKGAAERIARVIVKQANF